MKSIGLYDPYLDTLGGGERYFLTVAEVLGQAGFQVDIFWSHPEILSKAAARFQLNFDSVNIKPDIFTPPSSGLITKIKRLQTIFSQTNKYDYFFYVSDGSIPLLFAKNNYLHFQVPFTRPVTLFDRLKVKYFYRQLICNSRFTANVISPQYDHPTVILYPPVAVDQFHPAPAKNQKIISVGRFDNILNAKRQDVLIDAFAKFYRHHRDWSLVLIGGSLADPSQNQYLNHLKFLAKDLPVNFIVNPDFSVVSQELSTASIYWHAAGYQVDESAHPEATEHFGIVVVEAMAAGCVPLVANRGGLKEIIHPELNGYLWDTIDELVAKTSLLVSHPSVYNRLQKQALLDCQQFSQSNFSHQLSQYFL